MAERLWRVELTDAFLERLDELEAFLVDAGAGFAFDRLLDELRDPVIRNLRRFPRMGRRYLDHPPQSVEALDKLARMPAGAPETLRELLHSDYLMLYSLHAQTHTLYLLSIRHHRQLSYAFERLWRP